MAKNAKTDAKGLPKFGMRDKLAYAAGDFGCNMSFSLKGTVQTFWLVYMMLETGLLSILLLLVQIWDAVNDPLIGSIIDSDKRKYKMGKFKTYIFIGACGLLVGGAAVFLPFPNAPVVLKAVLFIVGYVIWDAFYTIANVPYGSMLSLVTEDNGERAQLSTWRSVGSMIGNIVPMVLLPMLIWQKVTYDGTTTFLDKIVIPEGFTREQFLTNPLTGEAYQIGEAVLSPETGKQVEILLGERMFWVALIMGILGFIAFLFMIKNLTVRVDENSVKASEGGEKFNIITSFSNFMKNRPAVGATLAAMGMFLGMNSAATANTIMFATYFNKASMSGVVQLIGFLPMFLFMPFVKKIVEKYGKKEASVAGTIVSLVGGVIMLIFPTISNPDAALIVYLLGLVVFGLGMGVYTCVSWALMADAIDYNEWKFGTREEGTVYSLHSFFRKLAQGIGPSIVLAVMGALGYVSSLGTIGQSAQTSHNMCWLVAALYLVSAVLQFIGIAVIYNLDKKTLEKMHAELAARKAN
ncbi:MAG: MFS transporter [Oscillospiraceae bacterium]|nr:MFS transporter [Oscillospiraceae bacterium]MBQ7001100.1 MFS transporter [Oscillospiraceae bacterium]